MSKMTMPAVKVVRFNESDVIVASLTISNLGNTTFGDGVAKYRGVSYGWGEGLANPSGLYSVLRGEYGEAGVNIDATASADNYKTIPSLFECDYSSAIPVSAADGTYYWNSELNRWTQ